MIDLGVMLDEDEDRGDQDGKGGLGFCLGKRGERV